MTEPNKPHEPMSAQERLDLGTSYFKEGRFDKAIKALSSIRREEIAPEIYAGVQLGLGAAYYAQKDLEQAIEALSSIRRDDDSKTYAWAQIGLGIAYNKSGKLDEAIKIWSNIRHDDDPKAYAQAQLNLGAVYYAQEDLDQAIKTWSNIRSEEADPETYAQAQLGLGTAYAESGKPEQAIKTWSNINREEVDPETYVEAQLGLGEVYSLDKETEEQSHKAYDNVRDFSYYKFERGFKILKCPVELRKELHSLAKNTDEVLKYLQIIPGFESKVAHYTRPQIAFDLFEDKKNDKDKEPSNFRLSTIRGVNDPTEGLVLNGYWNQQGIPETIHTNDTATFISCFTFNHDNLNQFRLYGKENGREATGVSLVFNKDFFSDQADTLEFIAGPSTDLSSKSKQIKPNETGKPESDNKKPLIGKSTLYRCIYIDPETRYLTLAQRDKSTFYREHDEDADAKEKWEKYHKSLSKKEKSVNKHLFAKDKSVLSTLQSIFKKYQGYSTKEKQYILETIRFTLLPLQYLVKHIAFQEEQECRIMYITQFRDEKIHSDREEQKMYVEYEVPVLPHIDKIWLSPGAAKYQDFFRILLDKEDNDDKVRISQNPFRNKE
ncbi:tetratricopeptide repeat protein [Rothia aeria]|uniref:tetratricopeptide repeat protein n=1 Tax=Rothia aeria TaxID=172042 RepID=UPI0028EFFA22|nr:tetratricopeptide repeat protein [Rothia aeria]